MPCPISNFFCFFNVYFTTVHRLFIMKSSKSYVQCNKCLMFLFGAMQKTGARINGGVDVHLLIWIRSTTSIRAFMFVYTQHRYRNQPLCIFTRIIIVEEIYHSLCFMYLAKYISQCTCGWSKWMPGELKLKVYCVNVIPFKIELSSDPVIDKWWGCNQIETFISPWLHYRF